MERSSRLTRPWVTASTSFSPSAHMPHEQGSVVAGGSSILPSAYTPSRASTHEDRGGQDIYWIVTLIVGWLASIVMKTNAQMGAIANIVVGIVGSSLGFWLAGALGLSTGGPIVGWWSRCWARPSRSFS